MFDVYFILVATVAVCVFIINDAMEDRDVQ